MIRNVISFNEATYGHDRRAVTSNKGAIVEYRCNGCSWRHEKAGGANAHKRHLVDVWKRRRDGAP